jgi:hypothetical protein
VFHPPPSPNDYLTGLMALKQILHLGRAYPVYRFGESTVKSLQHSDLAQPDQTRGASGTVSSGPEPGEQ